MSSSKWPSSPSILYNVMEFISNYGSEITVIVLLLFIGLGIQCYYLRKNEKNTKVGNKNHQKQKHWTVTEV
ncbi:unnamed protein product [Callosobruchus maculatus]|uniref:Uncharacterized protein n=1 Tax=Callosobruchus maculatus TaxID=64391 RepID=A0A653BUF3_CALMS|nr:unnamed protein product [Callosobruchus maculatus]